MWCKMGKHGGLNGADKSKFRRVKELVIAIIVCPGALPKLIHSKVIA